VMEDHDERHDLQKWARTPEQLSMIRMEQVEAMLAEEIRLDPIRELRDTAAAARVYAKQRGMGQKAQNLAAEVRLRAERRMGEILATMPKYRGAMGNKGGRGAPVERKPDDPPTMADLGLDRNEAQRMRWLARVPREALQNALGSFRESKVDLTFDKLRRAIQSDPAASGGVCTVLTPEEMAPAVTDGLLFRLRNVASRLNALTQDEGLSELAQARCETARQMVEVVIAEVEGA